MNNSQVAVESEEVLDLVPKFQEEEARIIRILEAIAGVKQTKEWSTLKAEVFDKLAAPLIRELGVEAKKEDPDPKRLNRLAGELRGVEKSNLEKLESDYKLKLQGVRTHKS